MALSPAQITEISLAALITYGEAQTLSLSLNAAQEAKMGELLGRWATAQDKFSYLNGKIAGYVTDNRERRLAIRNSIRGLLGLSLISDELQFAENSFGAVGSSNVCERFEF